MTLADPSPNPPALPPAAPPSLSPRIVMLVVVALLGLVSIQAPTLWKEWRALELEQERTRDRTLIGYVNIHPNVSVAEKPANWFHDVGDSSLLWSGWTPGVGHSWFRVGRGELDRSRISGAFGRDALLAIDRPVVEIGGGDRWGRIPPGALVAGMELNGVASVYPLLVLKKVAVVNDQVCGRPYLITYTPTIAPDRSIDVYLPLLDGQRVTMGLSGYFLDREPMYYDRGTESFWIGRHDGLIAIAGPLRGSRLRRIGRPTPVPWADWQARYPRSRLIVGADRSQPSPRAVAERPTTSL